MSDPAEGLKPAPQSHRPGSLDELAATVLAATSLQRPVYAAQLAAARLEELGSRNFDPRLVAGALGAIYLSRLPDDERRNVVTQMTDTLIDLKAGRRGQSTADARQSHVIADPVEHSRGEFVHEATDCVVRGAGIDFVFHRTYRHQTIYAGPLGHRWDHGYNLFLRVDDLQAVLWMGGGRSEQYVRHGHWGAAGCNYYVPPDGIDATLEPIGVPDAPVGWMRRAPDGLRHVFEPEPGASGAFRLARIEDRWGNHLRFVHDTGPSGVARLVRCHVNSDQRWVQLAYDQQDRIVRVSDHDGRTWRYTYDAHGDLTYVTTPGTPSRAKGCTTEYRYSSREHAGALAHLLTDIFDAEGRHYLRTSYGIDRASIDWNRVVKQRVGTGDYWFRYEAVDAPDLGLAVEDLPTMRCWVKERNGHQALYVYNGWGTLLWKQELDKGPGHAARQVVWRYRYNRDGALTASRTPEGVVRHLLTERDHFLRVRGIAPNSDEAARLWDHPDLTADARRGFGRVLATVDRAATHVATTFAWADRWGDAYAVGADDIVIKNTYEPAYGQPLTTSDPRATTASDPRATEGAEYARLLTRFEYTGPASNPTRDLVRVVRPTPTLPDGTVGGPVVTEILARDARGRVTRARDAVGVESATEYFPEAEGPRAGFLHRATLDPGDRAAGHLAITTQHTVDDLGRVTSTTLPRGVDAADGRFVVATEYDALDRVVTSRRATPLTTETRTQYEPAGKPRQIETDWAGPAGEAHGLIVRRFYYDEELRVRKETFGGPDLGRHRRVAHKYGANGLVTVTVRANDNSTQWRYDSRDLLMQTVHGAGVGEGIEELVRDRDGRVVEHRSPEGRTTRTEYDAFGRVIAATDALGNVTRTSYDRAGHPTVVRVFERRVDPAPIGESFLLLARAETVYDELGRPSRQRVARFDDPPPGVVAGELATAYELAGPGRALETLMFFDAVGRVVRMLDPLGNATTTEYDAAGHVVRATDPTGSRLETTYDTHGNVVRVDRRDVVRDLTGTAIGEEVITSFASYDERDRVIATTDPLGNVTAHEYDSLDREVRTVDSLGNATNRSYDVYGNLVEVRELRTSTGDGTGAPLPPHVVRYEHDGAGLVKARIDALGRRTEVRFDNWDRAVEQVFPDGARVVTTYDRDSLVVAVRDAHGVVIRNQHDPLGRPVRTLVDTAELDADLTIEGTRQIDRSFDALGRVRSAANETCAIATRFDSLGLPVAESTTIAGAPALHLARRFDDAGRLIGLTYPSGREVAHHHDAAGRLTAIRHVADGAGYPGIAAGPRTLVEYAHVGGRHRAVRYANGTATTFAHDAAGRAIEVHHTAPAGTILRVQQLRDAAGSPRLRLEQSTTARIEHFGYDSRYQLATRVEATPAAAIDLTTFTPLTTPPVGVPTARQPLIDAVIGPHLGPDAPPGADSWAYDLTGNRVRVAAVTGGAVDYTTVDPRDRYTDVAGTAHSYDRAGNLTGDGANDYRYDAYRRLVRVVDRTTGADVARYAYDASGRRVIQEHGTDRLVIAHDGVDRIADFRAGICVAQYVHGPAVDDPVHLAAAGTEHTYHADLQGSVRALTTTAGTIAATYRFDPFGVPLDATGPALGSPGGAPGAQPFGYAGRPLDPATGHYDFRARAYVPSLGRFLQRDPAGPVDGHLYSFAGNHPLAFGDPSGLARRERADLERNGQIARNRLRGMINTWGPAGQGYWWEELGQSAANTTVGGALVRNKQRVFGGLRTAGGFGIASVGAGLAVIPGGQVVGGVLVAVGVDQMAAGAIEVATNRPQESYLHRGARAAGGQRFADNFEMAATVVAPTGAAATARASAVTAGGLIRRRSQAEAATLYRGVNEGHALFFEQSTGVVRPNHRWYQIWKRSSTALEHNVGQGGTLSSPYTSWTTDPDVAQNYARRPSGSGVVLEAKVPTSRLHQSPNLKDVWLIHQSRWTSEAEVLIEGTVRVGPDNISHVP